MKRIRLALCLIMCLALLPLPALAQEAPAPVIRVLLRRLNLTNRADLYLDGIYTAHTDSGLRMAFPRGSEVTLQIRQGELFLFYEGMSMGVGKAIRLVRNASADQEKTGIRFEKMGNFYPGDLLMSVDEGGLLRPVLSLSVEDYLLGVVPYEMSDGFPLEALKAQAVCARTYALSKVNEQNDYDVVDTTNDQVFKGVNLAHQNAIRAVEETAGVVGTYNGALAMCYYSASNGGQTELVENVWSGRGDWSYYAMVDDPYDLENPESIVRRAVLKKDGSGLKPAFIEQLALAMEQERLSRGFSADPSAFRVDRISAVMLQTPEFDEPSRFMTELSLTIAWSGRRQTGEIVPTPEPVQEADEEILLFTTPTPTPEPAVDRILTPEPVITPIPILGDFEAAEGETTVVLPLFPAVVEALGISIYGADNELITVVESENNFTLEARRYGHGVGMSQRGAQWMAAAYGKLFHEILRFYYPGMTLMRVQAGQAALPTTPPELAATLEPPATPTPRPTLMPVTASDLPEGAWLASVEGIDDDSSLNLRQEPSQSAQILMRLYKHQQLIVLETCDDPAWVHVKTDVTEGYVMVSFLERIGE